MFNTRKNNNSRPSSNARGSPKVNPDLSKQLESICQRIKSIALPRRRVLPKTKRVPNNNRRVRRPKPYVVPPRFRNKQISLSTGAAPARNNARLINNMGSVANPQNNIMTSSNLNKHAYINCRLDPFSSSGSLGIPDNNPIRKIVIDFRTFSNINILKPGAFSVLTTPTLPYPVYIKSSIANMLDFTFSTAAGSVVATLDGSPNLNTNWSPLIVIPELLAFSNTNPVYLNPGAILNVPNPYGSVRARIVTVATRIYYTGQANVCSGTLSSSTVTVESLDGQIGPNTQPIQAIAYGNGNSTVIWPTDNVSIVPVTYNLIANTMQQDTVSSRPEAGGYSLLKHQASDYKWNKVQTSPVLFQSQIGNPAATFLSYNDGLGYPGSLFYDFDWACNLLSITNATPNMSFRVENVFCIEFELQQGSAFERLAHATTPALGDVLAASKAAQSIPTMLPVGQSLEPWYQTATRVAARIGKTILETAV